MNSYFGASFYDRLFDLFLSLKSELIPWVGAIIMVRVLINLMMFKSVSEMAEIIKDVFFGMILLCFFIEIVKFSQMIPNILHGRLSSPDQMEVKFSDERWSMWTISSYIAVGSYWVAKLIYTLFVGILIATGAFVIVAGTMLAQRYLLNLFFICLFGASLMPLFWYAINEGMKSLAQSNEQPISNFAILLVGELFKIGIPIVGAVKFFKNPFTDTVKSGASMTIKGMATVSDKSIGLFHPESKARKLYRVVRGQNKMYSLNRFPSYKSKYNNQRNKAVLSNWKKDKTPKNNRHENNDISQKKLRNNNVSSKFTHQKNKLEIEPSMQNKQKTIVGETPTFNGASRTLNNQNKLFNNSGEKKAPALSSNKEFQTPSIKPMPSKIETTNDPMLAQKSTYPIKNMRSADPSKNYKLSQTNNKKEILTKPTLEAPITSVESRSPRSVNPNERFNEVNL